MADHEHLTLGDEAAEPGSSHSRRQVMLAAAMAGAGTAFWGQSASAQAKPDPTTPVSQTGFTPAEVQLMTANGQKLTVEDLHNMRVAGFQAVLTEGKTVQQFLAGYKTQGGMAVSAEDIDSLHKANGARHERLYHGKQTTVCCCCSPCCTCASAVTDPVVDRRV